MKCRRSIFPRSSTLCGRSGFPFLAAFRSSAPFHNGSESCIFLPLWKPRNWPFLARGTSWASQVLHPLPQRQRNPYFPAVAEAPELAVPCGRCFPWHPCPPPLATTAAEPVFSCRCGSPGTGRPLREMLPVAPRSSDFPAVAEAPELAVPCGRCFPWHPGPPPLATTAANPAFSCRCGSTEVPILSLCILGVWQYAENE